MTFVVQFVTCDGKLGEVELPVEEAYDRWQVYADQLLLAQPLSIQFQAYRPPENCVVRVSVAYLPKDERKPALPVTSVYRACEHVCQVIDASIEAETDIVVPQPKLIIPK